MTQPRVIGGRYELGELIGYGGMAEVHLGRDMRLNRDVAIKVLRADLARDPSFLARFRREAHSAAGLNHPSIVAVYDTGEEFGDDGVALPYIVMEFVQGRTLRDILRSEGRLPARRAMEITADICAALDFSHRNGIVHRDVKPANVMITPTGAVKVMDFGIARAVADTSATVTQTANVIGTAQYLSPEQARGEAVDARSDVYSTGCLLYELVAGVPPFQGDSPVAVAYQHVRENPVMPSARVPDIPRVVDSVVMKALAKNQANRYQSAGDMRGDLQRALANQPVQAEAVMTDAERTQFIARTPPPLLPPNRMGEPEDGGSSRRAGLIWAAVVVALLIVIGVAGYAIVHYGKDDTTKSSDVPDVIGQSATSADQFLRKAGFVPQKGEPTSGSCANGVTGVKDRVCLTDPASGEKLKVGTVVTYQLFSPRLIQVPYVEGKSYSDAVQIMQRVGLKTKPNKVNSTEPANQVIHQDTTQFTNVSPGTTIELDVSTGKVLLPDVKGKDFTDAQMLINKAGFTNIKLPGPTKKTSSQKKANTVADESPSPGLPYDPKQQIVITRYVYEAPPPTCTTPPPTTSTPPPTSSSASSSSGSSSSGSSSSGAPSGSPGGSASGSSSGSGSDSPAAAGSSGSSSSSSSSSSTSSSASSVGGLPPCGGS